ncbi:hypothetical protein [Streptomyces sp. NPDC000888]
MKPLPPGHLTGPQVSEAAGGAAALLREGYTPGSVTAAIASNDPELLRQACCNQGRTLYFDNHRELRHAFALFVQAYEGDPCLQRVGRAFGDERIDFHNGVSVLFRVGPGQGRHFHLHLHHHVFDGWELDDGQALVIDDPIYGLTSAAPSLMDLIRGYGGGHIEWLDHDQHDQEEGEHA